MSAGTLRRAAALMRERAEAASPPPWVAFRARATNPLDRAPIIGVTRDLAVDYDTDLFATQKCRAEDAEHIASWHPAVALAVADWLDHQAYEFDRYMNRQMDPTRRFNSLWLTKAQDEHADALAVARAYLGED